MESKEMKCTDEWHDYSVMKKKTTNSIWIDVMDKFYYLYGNNSVSWKPLLFLKKGEINQI